VSIFNKIGHVWIVDAFTMPFEKEAVMSWCPEDWDSPLVYVSLSTERHQTCMLTTNKNVSGESDQQSNVMTYLLTYSHHTAIVRQRSASHSLRQLTRSAS